MTDHPSLEKLERLLDETLSDTERQQIDAHVNQCPECQQALARLTDTAEGVDWHLLRAPTAPARDSLDFLDRIKHTPPAAAVTGTIRERRPRDLEGLRNWQESLEQEQEFRILE